MPSTRLPATGCWVDCPSRHLARHETKHRPHELVCIGLLTSTRETCISPDLPIKARRRPFAPAIPPSIAGPSGRCIALRRRRQSHESEPYMVQQIRHDGLDYCASSERPSRGVGQASRRAIRTARKASQDPPREEKPTPALPDLPDQQNKTHPPCLPVPRRPPPPPPPCPPPAPTTAPSPPTRGGRMGVRTPPTRSARRCWATATATASPRAERRALAGASSSTWAAT